MFVEPQEPGKGREVESAIKGGAIPKEFIPELKKNWSVSDSGILAGSFSGYKVIIVDGLHHDVDSSVLAFGLQVEHALKKLVLKVD